jgi:prepilin-type N-terminal cleavage/methylation domain-containing protein
MRKRHAFSLVEMSVVMALMGIILAVAGAILYAMVDLEGAESGLSNRNSGVFEVAELFRNDISSSKSVRLIDTRNLELALHDANTVKYQFDGKILVRASSLGSQRLLRSSVIEDLSFKAASGNGTAALSFSEKGKLEKSPSRLFFIQACVGGSFK